jgi:DNA-binding transcriptional LysR family regulator
MELRQLEYFVAVAEEASFTRAAERVHVAQSGVSAQIRRLERELGQELFDRDTRTVKLTGVGMAVLPYARRALEAVGGARAAVDELTGLVRGRVAVGMIVSCPVLDLPALLAEFHREHPGVEITLREDNSDRLLQGLHSGELDLALVGVATRLPAGVDSLVLTEEPLVAAVAHGHPLATKSKLTLAALSKHPLISLPRGTGLRTCLDEACASAAVQPRIAFEASDPRMLGELAALGLGVAIMAESMAAARAAQLYAIPVTAPSMRSRIELAWRTEGSIGPAARELIADARRSLS